jgi:pyruvate-formate lyase-activating enzyme
VRESIQKEDIKALVPKIDEMVEDLKGDQLENYKKLCKKQKEKIKRLEIDLRDIGYENYKDKEELLE